MEGRKEFTLGDKLREIQAKSSSIGEVVFGAVGIAAGMYFLFNNELEPAARYSAGALICLTSVGGLIDGVRRYNFWNGLYNTVHRNLENQGTQNKII